MPKGTIRTILLAALLLFLAPATPARAADLPERVRNSGVLRVGSQQTYPPIEFREPRTKAVQGVSAELLAEIARRLGLRLEWVQSDYGALITGARAGRFDVVSGGISDQPERQKELDFVNYMRTGTGILCLAERAGEFHTIADFSGKKVAFTLGAKRVETAVAEASAALRAAGAPPIESVMLPNTLDAKMQLDIRRVDGYLNETPTLAYMMRQNPGKYALVQDGAYILTHLATSWGFAKSDDVLRDAVRRTAQEMLEDGTYAAIMTKWNLAGSMLPAITINQPMEGRP